MQLFICMTSNTFVKRMDFGNKYVIAGFAETCREFVVVLWSDPRAKKEGLFT